MASLMDGRVVHADGHFSVTGYHPTQAHCGLCDWHGTEFPGRPADAGKRADAELTAHAQSRGHAAEQRLVRQDADTARLVYLHAGGTDWETLPDAKRKALIEQATRFRRL